MNLLILKPTSDRGNYLALVALDQRSLPQNERSREMMLPMESSLPRGIKSDLSLP